jgi:glyoxylase-like metal-dependent hydrolase (beta-lactamase superfamily II)
MMPMNPINKRSAVLAAIVVFGTLSIVVAGLQMPPPGPTPASLKATTIEKVRDNLYVITGSSVSNIETFSGGNTAVFVTDKGVVLVDTKLPGWGQPILNHIKTVTDKPVTTIINTHTHDDHVGTRLLRRLGRDHRP